MVGTFLSLFSFAIQDLIAFVSKPLRVLQFYITNKFHVAGLGETFANKVFKYYDRVFARHQVYFGPNKYTQMRRIYWLVLENLSFEKTFHYRRSGVFHTQFVTQRRSSMIGVENGKDAQQFKFLLRFNVKKYSPSQFSSTPFQGNSKSILFLNHNYTAITQSKHLRTYFRSYFFPDAGSSWVIEFFLYPAIMILLFVFFAFMVEIVDFFYGESDNDIYYESIDESVLSIDENKEAEISAQIVSQDLFDILEEDDQYLNNDLANLRNSNDFSSDENEVDLNKFYAFRAMNYMYNEFKSFSILYPIYRLILLMLPYGWRDFLFLSDSTKVYSYFFQIILYLPVALSLFFFKLVFFLVDFFFVFPLLIRIFLILLFFFSLIIYDINFF